MKNGTYMHVYMYMYIEFTDYTALYMWYIHVHACIHVYILLISHLNMCIHIYLEDSIVARYDVDVGVDGSSLALQFVSHHVDSVSIRPDECHAPLL